MVPGQILSNDGRSHTASVFTQAGPQGDQPRHRAHLGWVRRGGGRRALRGVRRARATRQPGGSQSAGLAATQAHVRRSRLVQERARHAGCSVRKAFVRAYKAMDKDFRSRPPSTASAVGSDLYMANIGDSRAVLGSRDAAAGDMVAVQLPVDLKPDLPSTPLPLTVLSSGDL